MNLEKLFTMQKGLDSHIEAQHNLQTEDLFDRKVLALLVELGELANETRCFKFWSLKPASEKEVILEEFVDGIHFILSLGIEAGFTDEINLNDEKPQAESLTEQFLTTYATIEQFRQSKTRQAYQEMFQECLYIAQLLGFTSAEIEQAYIKKNEVNYERQEQGY
ncbi:dUTP diphosphatase [Bacillus marasmi]|uniref:dUTP diphosphatase n=1 Tax=Bacillus marasmi TaxID=1926279 RepID=UPI0011C9F55B|nr:dUTP diphosphatase [Bacillus marasmi]